MRIVDISHSIRSGMQVYPGDPEVRVETVATVGEDGYQVASLRLGSHTGTHLDAPLHSVPGAAAVDEIDLARLVGIAVVVDCEGRESHAVITWSDVGQQVGRAVRRAADEGAPPAMVLFRTGWSRHFGTQRYLEHPVLAADVAEGLLAEGITLMGSDTLSPDSTLRNDGALPFHALFQGAGGLILENLTNLAAADWAHPLVSVFPLALAGVDGSPVRAVAMQPDA
ncbi:cyclase family protein [Arthrobacter bussei]|uniref:Cyclase family protein n=1 Tax=Arthrobacter bussei TaxID=2594179 RepID=A0A7X1NP02_9MICC|nr:cyclase family protein [Arthrobacter bussei]MPY10278.1 cyclase family protein [Arthrobacter bussei]